MAYQRGRRIPPQLNSSSLQELALRYVAKYATTRVKLRAYLARKLQERGWEEPSPPDLERLADRFAELGYVDDRAFALSTSRALAGRGYGKRRLSEKLRHAGVEEADGADAQALADQEAVSSAMRFAQRRKLGPFAAAAADPPLRQKWVAAMVRAGHSFGLAQAITRLPPGTEVQVEALQELISR